MLRNRLPIKRLFLILPLFLSAAFVMGFGAKDQASPAKSEAIRPVRVTGRVRLTGSGPGQELVITGTDREWRINKEDQNKLWDLQQQTVTVEGRETSKEMKFANGTSAGTWYFLENIKIIEPKPEK
ncbi:hypothetical protein AGMMS50268_14240 [Spirochaetia bacterium]|nr:hypothetical protein AGMMS50268_14240 [Spirochaetia bacterium]